MAGVKIKNFTKKFGDVTAVENISLDIKDREFLVLLGPSGCGKSTILRSIAGLEEPTGGEIYIDDKLVNDVPPKDRGIAMVFQSYAIYPHMTVKENMAFPLKMKKMKKNEIEERVDQAAKVLNMGNLLDRKPKELSGGQRQRVALGRAIVRNPKAFLMDEPLSNLDAKLRTYMRAELKKLHERIKTTIIYVTHDQVEAMTMASRISLLKDGVLQQLDTPDEIYNNPSNSFVGGFIGTPPMNFAAGEIENNNFVCKDFSYTLPARLKTDVKKVMLGIRPEDIEVRDDGEISGEAYVIEPLGSETLLSVKIGENTFMLKIKPDLEIKVEDKLSLRLNDKKIHLFDGETLNAIAA